MSTRYRYRASTDRGEIVEGVTEADSRRHLLDQLRQRDLHALVVEEVAGRRDRPIGGRGRGAAVTRWSRSFAALTSAGIPLSRALQVSAEQCDHPGLAKALSDVRRGVQAGESLSEALARQGAWFPPVVPAMARAGEASGTLGEVFEEVADHLEEVDELKGQVGAALVYPGLMAVVASIGVAVLMLFVVPRFAGILEDFGGTLPPTTRALIWAGGFLGRFWWLLLGLAAAIVIAVRAWLDVPTNRTRWHEARLGLPIVGGLELKLIASRFTRTLGLLLTHGVPLLSALRIARASVENLHAAGRLDELASSVGEGRRVAEGMKGLLPSLAVEMLSVGEESGRLGAMCMKVADTYDKEVRRALKIAVSLIEPAMIVTFGVLVGFIALAMLQAIYSVNSNLG